MSRYDEGVEVDFSHTAEDYARHRVGFPDRFFRALRQDGLLKPGATALDLGTGTGLVARALALGGMQVTGVDRATPLLEQARRLDAEAGCSVRYLEREAEHLDLRGETFDLVLAGQCWHWFDRPRVLQEVASVLAPGNPLVIAHFDWLPMPGNMVASTEDLILRYSPDWKLGGGDGRYPQWLPELEAAGFQDIQVRQFETSVAYRAVDWRGRIRASAGVAASLPPGQVKAFDRDLEALLRTDYPEDPLEVPHRMWWTLCYRPKIGTCK